MRPVDGVFGAPLSAVAAAVTDHFGCVTSRSAIRNLLSKTRRNTKSTARGEVEARPGRVVGGERRPHRHARWSARLFKRDKQLIALLQKQDIKVFQVHGDDMAKVPLLIPARRRRRPPGFLMATQGGKPSFAELDHSFPVAELALLATSGWVFCDAGAGCAGSVVPSKPQLRTGRPCSVRAFVRAVRYAPTSVSTHMKDLLDALAAENVSGVEVGLVGVDNGADYSIQSPSFRSFYCAFYGSTTWPC